MIAKFSTYLFYLYTVTVYGALVFSLFDIYVSQQDYFTTAIIYFDNPSTSFILYNLVLVTTMVMYKAIVWIFFQESKQNQNIKITQKLMAKAFDIIIIIYVTNGQLSFQIFSLVILLILIFVVHTHAICRSQYLIHTPTLTTLSLNYRLLGLFLVLIFIDYEILKNFISWLASDHNIAVLFVYQVISISLSILEPSVKYFADFYQKYTYTNIQKLDEYVLHVSALINIVRCIIQILLSVWIAHKFGLYFFFIISFVVTVTELGNIIKSYRNMKKLTDTIKNLKRITEDEIKQMHDQTCMVCFHDMKTAVILPCKHAFHEECLRQWILKNSNHFCPKCKKSFNFDTQNTQQEKQTKNRQAQPQNRNEQANNRIMNGNDRMRILQLVNQLRNKHKQQGQKSDKKDLKSKKIERSKKQRLKKLIVSSRSYKKVAAQKSFQKQQSDDRQGDELQEQIKRQLSKIGKKSEIKGIFSNKKHQDKLKNSNPGTLQFDENMRTIDYDKENFIRDQQRKYDKNKFCSKYIIAKSLNSSQNYVLNNENDYEDQQSQVDDFYNNSHKQSYKKQIGSLPFGLPTEAIYNRKQLNMRKRQFKICRNDEIIQLLKKSAVNQMLRLPQ